MALDWAGAAPRAEVVDFLERTQARLGDYADLDAFLDDPERGFVGAAAKTGELATRYQEPFRLVVVGDYNAGKSSLINALLHRENFLAERRVATTGTITELWWGKEESGEVVTSDGTPRFAGDIAKAILYADQNTSEGKSIAHQGARIVLHLTAAVLRDLVIIDTPGLGASEHDNKLTRAALDLADAAILVVSALQPVTDETRQLAEWLQTHERRALLAVTWLDKVADADEADDVVGSVIELLGAVIDGDPVRVNSPAIHKDLAALENAELHADADAADAARDQLLAHGYTGLVERLGGDFAFGDAGLGRQRATMASVAGLTGSLAAAARRSSAAAQEQADAVHAEVSDLLKRVHTIVPDQARHLDESIAEAIDVRVAAFMARFSEAVYVFIDKLAAGGLKATARAVQSITKSGRERVARQVQRDFADLFPDSQMDIALRDVTTSVTVLLEAGWSEATTSIAQLVPTETFNIDAVTRDISSEIASANAATVSESASWVLVFFGPAGIVFQVALFVLMALRLRRPGQGKAATIARQKREADVRIASMRATVVDQVGTHYRDVNASIRDSLIAKARKEQSGKEKGYDELKARLHRMNQALADLARVEDSASGLSGEGGLDAKGRKGWV
jgi:small GTP-binding protein